MNHRLNEANPLLALAGAQLLPRDGVILPHTQQCHFNPINPCEGYKIHYITINYFGFARHSDSR